MDDTPASPPVADDLPESGDPVVTPLPGAPRPPLTRATVRRLGWAALSLALVLCLPLFAVRLPPVQRAWSRLTHPPAPTATPTPSPAVLSSADWISVAPPVSPAEMRAISPSPADASTAYACSGPPVTPDLTTPAGPITLWRTRDFGTHWSRLALHSAVGTSCYLNIAPDTPDLLALTVVRPDVSDAGPCPSDDFYLSADAGATWRPVSSAGGAVPYGVQTSCGLFPTARHLYFSGVFAPPQSSVAAATSILLRSDDLGAHWTRIDDWPGNAFTLVQPPIGDVLTVELATGGASPSGSGPLGPTIEQSANAGASWAQLGNAPGNAHLLPQQPMPNPASSPSSTAPLYAVGGDQIPNSLFRERVYAGDGQTWHLLPPLPVPGATPLRQGITNVLIALPDGRLLASGADPTAGVPQSNTNLPPIQRQ